MGISDLFKRNDALAVNNAAVNGGLNPDIAITVRGSDWYFTVCAVMTVATIVFSGLSLTKPRTHRVFHYITAGVTFVAAIAYFTMGANLGFASIAVEFPRTAETVAGNYREIFYVRYIDWVITTPLLLMDLLLTAGMPWPTILFTILIDEIMIITGLVGALISSVYKWPYWIFGNIALFYILYMLLFEARIHANHLGSDIGRVFLMTGSLTSLLWLLYPIAWGVSEGGNVIAPDSEAIFYGILDLLAKPVFGAILLFGHRNIDPSRLGLRIRDYDEDPSVVGGATSGSEKRAHGTHGTHATNGLTNGHHTTNGTTAVATDPATTV